MAENSETVAARAAKLSAGDWRMLIEAAGLLVGLHVALRIVQVRRIADWCGVVRPTGADADTLDVARLVRMSEAAARRVPGSACLIRSLALVRMLAVRGVKSDLRIGVRAIAGAVEGHAWVERNGRPLNDEASHVETFTLIDLGTPSDAMTWRAISR